VRNPHAVGCSGHRKGQPQVRGSAGAARLREHSVGAQRSAQRGGKPRVECKGKSRSESGAQRAPGARKRGLAILGESVGDGRGVGKVTAGITGLWRLRVRIDGAF